MNKSFILSLTAVMIAFNTLSQVYVPNAFTPDNDGYNDIFIPISSDTLATYSLQIYNAYGELIFHTTDIEQGWDGGINYYVPTGIYPYKLVYRQHDTVEEKVVYGYVKLLR